MSHAVQLNVKDMAITLGQVLQLAPANLWGEPLHVSGLFAFIVKSLKEDKVKYCSEPDRVKRTDLGLVSTKYLDVHRDPHGVHSRAFQDRSE